MATQAAVRYLTVDEFLQIDFGPDLKAELDNGLIRMMAGGSREHGRVQANLIGWFGTALRGSGCRPYGSDAAVHTASSSIRYPDVTIDCGPDEGPEREATERLLADPRMVIEILSPSTRAIDEGVKFAEYRQIDGLQLILYIDPVSQHLRLWDRSDTGRWIEHQRSETADLFLAPLGLTLPHAEIFARD